MNRRDAKIYALSIATSLIFREVDSPTDLTAGDDVVWDNQEKIHAELTAIAENLEKRLLRLTGIIG